MSEHKRNVSALVVLAAAVIELQLEVSHSISSQISRVEEGEGFEMRFCSTDHGRTRVRV